MTKFLSYWKSTLEIFKNFIAVKTLEFVVEEAIIIRSFLFCRKSFLFHKHRQYKFTAKRVLLWLENVVSQDGEVTTLMLDDLWNVSARVFWIFMPETILNTHQLKITCSSTGVRTHYTQGRCEPAAWRPRVSANFPETGGGGGQSSVLPLSPESVSSLPPPCSWWQFAQGRYRLCSFQSLDIACFHRETNVKRTEAVWTGQEGQSWGN